MWRSAPRAADVAPGRHLRKEGHASSLDNARQPHCPGLHTSASESLHPILEDVRRRGIVVAIGTQSDLGRVQHSARVTPMNANQRVFELGRVPFETASPRLSPYAVI